MSINWIKSEINIKKKDKKPNRICIRITRYQLYKSQIICIYVCIHITT